MAEERHDIYVPSECPDCSVELDPLIHVDSLGMSIICPRTEKCGWRDDNPQVGPDEDDYNGPDEWDFERHGLG